MRFTALTLLALGASTSAYVVPNNKVVDNAINARMPASGPVRTSNLVSALAESKVEARHHRGKGQNAGAGGAGGAGAKGLASLFGRDAQEMTDAEDDAHWADLHTRSPHHRGKGQNAGAGGAGAGGAKGLASLFGRSPEAHHRGKNGAGAGAGGVGGLPSLFGRDAQEMTDAEDDAHWADLHTRSPHHRGKGQNAGVGAGAGGRASLFGRDPEAHHRGKNGKNGAGGAGAGAGGRASLFGRDAQEQKLTDAEDDAHWADLHTGDN